MARTTVRSSRNYYSYKTISGKVKPEVSAQVSQGAVKPPVVPAVMNAVPAAPLPAGFEPYNLKEIDNRHPFDRHQLSIVGRVHSATKDIFRFSASENGQHAFYLSSDDLVKAGYAVVSINDCSVKLIYKAVELFLTCSAQPAQQANYLPPVPLQSAPRQPLRLEPYP